MSCAAEVTAVLHDVADIVHATEPPADPDHALDLVAAAVAADKELLAMCTRIAEHHAEVREQWRQFDPAGRPPPGGGRRLGCLSVFSPLFWLRAIRSPDAVYPKAGAGEAGGRSATTESAPGNQPGTSQ